MGRSSSWRSTPSGCALRRGYGAGDPWEALGAAWERYALAAGRAGELQLNELEREASRIADLIEDGNTPNVVALAVLVALTVKQRDEAGAYPLTVPRDLSRRQVAASSS